MVLLGGMATVPFIKKSDALDQALSRVAILKTLEGEIVVCV